MTFPMICIIHIGKVSNNLDESELFGLDNSSYEIYHDESKIDEKFRKITRRILELKPKDVFLLETISLFSFLEEMKTCFCW